MTMDAQTESRRDLDRLQPQNASVALKAISFPQAASQINSFPVSMQIGVHTSLYHLILTRRLFNRVLVQAVRQISVDNDWSKVIRIVVSIGGIPQAEIARMMRVERSTVARWMAGTNAPPARLVPQYILKLSSELENAFEEYLSSEDVTEAFNHNTSIRKSSEMLRSNSLIKVRDQDNRSAYGNKAIVELT